ncbi:MAG: DUF899 family protein [Bdellovibrionales bacterium]
MIHDQPLNEIQKIESEIFALNQKLTKLRRDHVPVEVKNYTFQTLVGEVSLLDLFGDKMQLIAVHNMGQGCRYCTLWADGINGFLPHLEERLAVVLMSKDAPELQRRFANSRGWRFRMVSHGGNEYTLEQTPVPNEKNRPALVCYERQGNKIFRKNISAFGPGDMFCSIWPILSLAGLDEKNWTPQFSYWSRPDKMDDGGQNLI